VNQTSRHGRRRILFGAVALAFLSGCTGGLPNDLPLAGSIVDITVKDFAIKTPPIVAGDAISFRVYNKGPQTHEFVVGRSDFPADELPIGSDGLSVDEDGVTVEGEIEQVDTWTTQTLSLPLSPGRYVFFCNLEGHYLAGMYAPFEVTEGGQRA
jgi:uncharacterized cupredoxin-like copper-binding protein